MRSVPGTYPVGLQRQKVSSNTKGPFTGSGPSKNKFQRDIIHDTPYEIPNWTDLIQQKNSTTKTSNVLLGVSNRQTFGIFELYVKILMFIRETGKPGVLGLPRERTSNNHQKEKTSDLETDLGNFHFT